MKKSLFIILLVVSLVAVAEMALVFHLVLGTGRVYKPVEFDLSFKPFTASELLDFNLEVDTATCGEKLQSDKLDTIDKRVSEIRELSFEKPTLFRECPESVVRYELMESIAEESSKEELEADDKLLQALGLIEPDEDLEEILTDVYTEQVAGFYDTESKSVTIVEGKSTGSVMDEVTMAHEITHALQDQQFNLEEPPLENDDYNGDNDLAVLSLVEGDAMTTMLKYAREYVDIAKLMEEELTGSEVASEELEDAPPYIQRSLMFPYQEGMLFVTALEKSGGKPAVDDAFRDPPLASEQIMHPEKYIDGGDGPREVPLSDIAGSLGDGWEMINEDCMGEFDVNVWFEQYSGLIASVNAAGGWGGNSIQYYQGPGDDYVLVNMFAWDTPGDAEEFSGGYAELLEDRFEDELKEVERDSTRFVLEADGELFYCAVVGDRTLCVQAPDQQALDTALENFPEYP
ncbi:MAG: hypothetical protein KKH73_02370 [Actinobacteria bacterium]|nr:hypothetical protein [Actinomycetota bacterium]MBU4385819.1 hypothetical protein [Actinomycetota bacterium]